MTKETQSTTVSATASQADVTGVVQATEGENASAAQPDVNAQITAAVAAENSRIMGILNCEEAHGREEQARVLAETPGMTVETARRILAAAPQSAQRIEHLALMKRQAEQAESDSNRKFTVEDAIRSGSPDYSKYSVNTSSAGAHTHSVSGTAASAGAHAHTVGIGAHTHSVAIGSHGHTITVNAAGNAENTVKNIAFNYIVRLA